ncbi:MAG TPA: MDR family MFS transporter [Planctomycetota bacterium]|nr:MDR family MFS transporter [Planctomycetota bacterium]
MTSRRSATVGILFGIFLAAMENTVVVTALPTIVSHFKQVGLYFLPIAIAMIVSTITVPVAGRLSDLYGRRRFHLGGILFFIVGSCLCSAAQSMEQLVVFRAIQAVGVGALMTLSFTMIADLYPLEERAKMQGLIGGVWGLAALMGPPLGGLITSVFHWRGVFWVPVPLGVVSLVIIQQVWKDPPRKPRAAGPDVPGAVLLVIAAAALLGAFSFASRGLSWTSPAVFGLLALAVALVPVLAMVERRSHDPFMAVDLFRKRLFWTGTLCSALLAANMFCAIAYLPLFVQSVAGASPMKSGMVLTPMMLTWVACSSAAGFLLLRLGYRVLAMGGSLLAVVAYFMLSRMDAVSTWGEAAIGSTVLGAGLGFVMSPLLIAAQNSVGRERLGAATSLIQFCRSMAGALGVAVAGTVMAATLVGYLKAHPNIGFTPDQIVHPVIREQVPFKESQILRGIMAESLRPVFSIGLGVAVMAFLAALLLPAGRARDLRSAEAIRTPDSPS